MFTWIVIAKWKANTTLFLDNISSLAEFIVKEYFHKRLNVWHFSENDSKTFIQLLLSALICYLRWGQWRYAFLREIQFILATVLSTHFLMYEFSCGTHTDQLLLFQRTLWLFLNLSGTFSSCNRNCWVLAWVIKTTLCECKAKSLCTVCTTPTKDDVMNMWESGCTVTGNGSWSQLQNAELEIR